MAKLSSPRAGSLQFWPRKRAEKNLPSVNWRNFDNLQNKNDGLVGFITYKVGMANAIVKDNTEHSMTKGKKIFVPVTILEAPPMKIYSVRFYSNNKIVKEIVVSNDKELKKIVKISKEIKNFESQVPQKYDDLRVIAYSLVKRTSVKRTPDILEIGIKAKDKIVFVKDRLSKELSLQDMISCDLVDVRGLTKGKGLSGPVKRFGITLKQHKTEKGVRRPGSLAPWHPARVTFHAPMAGQLGMFSRVHYNLNVVNIGSINDKNINPGQGFRHYGVIKTQYVIVKGSVQGPQKRQVFITPSFRPTKKQMKKKYEFQEIIL